MTDQTKNRIVGAVTYLTIIVGLGICAWAWGPL